MTFSDFLTAAGLIDFDVVQDGRWRRCATTEHPRKKNGSYKLAIDGFIGWCQDFSTHTEPLTWRPEGEIQKVDLAAIRARQNEARRTLVRATHRAREFYEDCKPLIGGHPYLESHGLNMTGCYGLKMDSRGWLVVPVMLGGEVISVQRISPEGDKKFWAGASVKGGSYVVERRGASITVLCEGLATGLAIFAAATLCRIIVCFNSGNLKEVQIPHRGLVVVAADNDHVTEARVGRNPGTKAAGEAAASLGCGVAIPQGIAGTDWADWRREKVAARLDVPGRGRETDIRRSVDAEIASAIAKNCTFLRPTVDTKIYSRNSRSKNSLTA